MLPALFGLVLLPDLHRMERWLLTTIVPVRWAGQCLAPGWA